LGLTEQEYYQSYSRKVFPMLKGLIVAMLTPFTKDGELYDEGVREVASWLISKGVHGLFVCGTAGEGLLMSTEERKYVAETVLNIAAGRVPVIVHCGALSTRESIELAEHAKAIHAQAAGVVTPGYYPLDEECLIQHFAKIANAVPDFPVYLYNLPSMAKNTITPHVLAESVRRAPNIIGIKDSSRGVDVLKEFAAVVPKGFDVIVGSDGILLQGLQAGAVGGVSALSSVFPEPGVNVYNAFLQGNLEFAQAQQILIGKLRDAVKTGPYLAAYKEALRIRGVPAGYPRSPLRPLTEVEKKEVEGLLTPLLAQIV
jgi:dihydrodipicolinate synthase/N-acetylneuraminate lyase